ncbi:MAG: haloacid dehalogenase type II [Bacteroidota bacterium]
MYISHMDFAKQLKALVFDAYGTLFHIGALNEELNRQFGVKSEQIGNLWRSKQLEYTWLRSLMGAYQPFSKVTADALSYACRVYGVQFTDEVLKKMVNAYYHLNAFPEVEELLGKLSRQYRLAVLSNANPEMLQQAVESNQLNPYFEKVLSVDMVKVFKPNPSVYQLAVESFGVDKKEIGFISTNTWDVAGAAMFGLSAIHLNRFDTHQDVLGQKIAPQIASLSELLD